MNAFKRAILFCFWFTITIAPTLFAGNNTAGICLKVQNNNHLIISSLNNTPLSNNSDCFTMEGIASGKYLLKISEFITENGSVKEKIIYCNYITLPPGKMQFVYIDGNNVLHIVGERKIETV